MAWLSATQIRQKFNISENSFANQITAALLSATLMMQTSIADPAVFAEGEATALTPENDNYLRQSKVVQSHAYLTWYFLLKDAGHELAKSGVIKQTATGTSSSFGNVVSQYLTPAELEKKINEALTDAQVFLGDYGEIPIGLESVRAAESQRPTSIGIVADW